MEASYQQIGDLAEAARPRPAAPPYGYEGRAGLSGLGELGATYTVVRGDTLSKIAQRHGTTVQAIANANGIRNVNLITVGQRLTIPTSTAAAQPGGSIFDLSNWLRPPTAGLPSQGAQPARPPQQQQQQRPTQPEPAQQADPNAALRGDVVDFELTVGPARRVAYYSADMTDEFRRDLIARGYGVQGVIDDKSLGIGWGQVFTSKGYLRGRVKINNDGHAHYEHVGQTIAGIAAAVGYNVQGSRSTLVSRARGGGGSGYPINPDTSPDPKRDKNAWDDFFNSFKNLGTGAVFGGAVVGGVVLIALLKD